MMVTNRAVMRGKIEIAWVRWSRRVGEREALREVAKNGSASASASVSASEGRK